MSAIRAAAVFTAFLSFIGCSKAPPASGELVGEVVDEHGKPVPGASVGIRWTVYQPSPVLGTETSADGRFRLPVPASLEKSFFPLALMVLDPGRQRGILKAIPEDELGKQQRCVLEPLVKVTMKWNVAALPASEGEGKIDVWPGFGGTFMESAWKRDDVVLMLPPGNYTLFANASWEKGFTQGVWDIAVVSGSKEMLVGPLKLNFVGRSGW